MRKPWFKQEVRAAQRAHGLCTALVIDSGADGPLPWPATAFVQGPTLSAAVTEHGALPVRTVLLLVAGVAEALQAVHAARSNCPIYHWEFADETPQPKDSNFDDFYYSCDDILGCDFGAYTTKPVLLDQGEAGSPSACLRDTRFTDAIQQPRPTRGSQVCARTETGIVALLTYQGGSPGSAPSEYATFDVTFWGNALPAQS